MTPVYFSKSKGRVFSVNECVDEDDREDQVKTEEIITSFIEAIEVVNPNARPDSILQAADESDIERLVGIIRGSRF
jgi:hypothetical protein